jgi:hypothetical protein
LKEGEKLLSLPLESAPNAFKQEQWPEQDTVPDGGSVLAIQTPAEYQGAESSGFVKQRATAHSRLGTCRHLKTRKINETTVSSRVVNRHDSSLRCPGIGVPLQSRAVVSGRLNASSVVPKTKEDLTDTGWSEIHYYLTPLIVRRRFRVRKDIEEHEIGMLRKVHALGIP